MGAKTLNLKYEQNVKTYPDIWHNVLHYQNKIYVMHEVCIQRYSNVGVKCQLAEIGASLCEGVLKNVS